MSNLSDRLRGKGVKPVLSSRKGPVWGGPEKDGISYSLLSRFLVCRERFRLLVVEGLKPADTFNHRLEFGNMWHICEEGLMKDDGYGVIYQGMLQRYAQALCRRYPTQQEQVDHWYNVCKVQFPIYVCYWGSNKSGNASVDTVNVFKEKVFEAEYQLPSRRVVKLRGKWDQVDISKDGRCLYLQENKTKGDIHEPTIRSQLTYDLQTMLYLIALKQGQQTYPNTVKANPTVAGVRYNVVRRPLSGGTGTIRQHKPSKSNPQGESKEHFYNRVREIIEADPGHYFMRWDVTVTEGDIAKFKYECLDPILEQLCDWWGRIGDPELARCLSPFDIRDDSGAIHWRHPYGVYNPLNEGGITDLDEMLYSGSRVGLQEVDNLFPELS